MLAPDVPNAFVSTATCARRSGYHNEVACAIAEAFSWGTAMIGTIGRISLVAGVALLSACSSDSTSLPSAPGATLSRAHVGGKPSATATTKTLVGGAQRTSGLASSITVTQAVGVDGGTLSIPQAGVTVTVPAGALTATTLISMTARAGKVISYDFAPHGTTFAKPLVFTQMLAGTNVSPLVAPLLELGYYADENDLTLLGGAVTELRAGSFNLLNGSFTSSIWHFSGYMVACGRE